MPTLSITNLRKDIYKSVELVNDNNEPILITNSKGKNAVLISESNYNSMLETIYLMSNKATYETIKKGMEEPIDNCIDIDEVKL